MSETVQVAPPVLRAHANVVGGVCAEVERCRAAAVRVNLGREAYGQLCQFLPDRLERATAVAVDTLVVAAGAVRESGWRLRAVAGRYEQADAVARVGLDRAGTGWGVRGDRRREPAGRGQGGLDHRCGWAVAGRGDPGRARRDRAEGWVDPAVAVGGAGLEALGLVVDPVGSLAGMGVAWLIEHVQPLSQALEFLAGDPDQIAAHAQTWANISATTQANADQLATAVNRDLAGWTGEAADAYRAHMAAQTAALSGIAQAAAGIAQATQGAGQLVAAVRMIVRDLVAEAVATLAARLPGWAAMTGGTLGLATPWVISQVATLVTEWVNRIHRFLTGLLNSLANLSPLLARLTDLLTQQRAVLDRLARHDPTMLRMADTGTGPPPLPPRQDLETSGGISPTSEANADVPRAISDPKVFDPESLRGMSAAEVQRVIPPDWTSRPSNTGGGLVFEDPGHRGRQIRVMPGYSPHSRPDELTHGPYVVVSQNGRL